MARIPPGFIDELLNRTDIVSLIESRLPLKKAGKEFQARCPFHDEKTPSFTVSPSKQFYHCFGCGAHGTALSFVIEYDRLEFRDAVEFLAAQVGMEVPDDYRAGPDAEEQQPLLNVLTQAERYYREYLRGTPEAINYLKGRGITGDIAKRYGIGFAPPGWDAIYQRLPDKRAAITSGLLIKHEDSGKTYDRFRNRIMFPIRDGRGRVIGFGGRTLGDDKAKYLNSPETPLFHKGRHLYGLYEARQSLKNIERMLVVEGYMDVVALAQHGFANAVATLGTATTAEHLQALFRVCDEVVFCFDGDAAGRRAGWRALEQSLPLMRGTRRVRFLFLPDGEDPDTLVRGANGQQRFQTMVDNSLAASIVLFNGLAQDVDLSTADGRSRLIEKARPHIEKLPPEAFKAQLIQEIAAQSGLPAQDLERLYQQSGTSPQKPETNHNAGGVRTSAVRRALQLLMNEPRLADNLTDIETLRNSAARGSDLLAEAIEFFQKNPTYTVAVLLERWRDREQFAALQRLAAQPPRGDSEHLATEFHECVQTITRKTANLEYRERYATLLARQQQGPLSNEEQQELQSLLQQIRANRG